MQAKLLRIFTTSLLTAVVLWRPCWLFIMEVRKCCQFLYTENVLDKIFHSSFSNFFSVHLMFSDISVGTRLRRHLESSVNMFI
jgi:hypothetical protein